MNKNRRNTGRLEMGDMECPLGIIQNISAGGMVVRGRPDVDYRREVTFGEGDRAVTIVVERVWSRRVGLRAHLVGYRFVDPPPNLMQRLCGVQFSATVPRVL